jgi:hypothetical protein
MEIQGDLICHCFHVHVLDIVNSIHEAASGNRRGGLIVRGTEGETDTRRPLLHLSVIFENRVREMPDCVTQVPATIMKGNVLISL